MIWALFLQPFSTVKRTKRHKGACCRTDLWVSGLKVMQCFHWTELENGHRLAPNTFLKAASVRGLKVTPFTSNRFRFKFTNSIISSNIIAEPSTPVNLHKNSVQETGKMLEKQTFAFRFCTPVCVCDIVNIFTCGHIDSDHICLVEDSSGTLSNHRFQRTKLTNMTPIAILKTVHQLPQLCKILKLDRINTIIIIIIMYYYYCHHHRLHHHHQNYRHYCHCY